MRLAFVTNVVYPYVTGGAQKRVYEIGTRLVHDGHDVTVYGRHCWDGPTEMMYDGLELRAVAPRTALYTGERRSISEAVSFAGRLAVPLRRQLVAGEHDLVVVSVFPYFPVLATTLARVTTDVPLVTTWHEVWRSYWEEYLGTLAPAGKLVERVTARVPQHPIAVSGVTADRLAQIGPRRSSITVIPNGIDVPRIERAPLPEENDEVSYDVLFVGRLIKEKNVSLVLDAFDTVADDYDITLGIIGDGPEATRLKRQASQLEHRDRIEFPGFLDEYDAVLGHMRAASVFVSPSVREGFGITLAEAMAADCTVIAASHPESAAEEVLDGGGFLVEPTRRGVTEAVDAALAGARPEREPNTVARQYDWDRVASRASEAYQRAIDGRWERNADERTGDQLKRG